MKIIWVLSLFVIGLVTKVVNGAAPSCVSVQNADIDVSAPEDHVVLDLGCSDSDPGDVLTYTFLDGNTTDQYKIENGVVKLAKNITPQIAYKYLLDIRVTDTTSSTTDVSILITILYSNNYTPVVTWPSSPVTISESTPMGTHIATCTVTDGDLSTNTLAGQTRVDFKSPEIAAANKWVLDSHSCELYINQVLDYNTKSSYTLNMIVTDLDPRLPRTAATSVTIFIVPGFDNPPTCTDYLKVVAATTNSPQGKILSTLDCQDADAGQGPAGEITYILDDTNDLSITNMFQVNPSDGSLSLKSQLPDTRPFYEVMIKVQDGATPNLYTHVLIRVVVTDVPQDGVLPLSQYSINYTFPKFLKPAPVDTRQIDPLPTPTTEGLPYCSRYAVTAMLPESTAIDEAVYDLGCKDPDGDRLNYKIIKGNVFQKFKIDLNGQLKLAKTVDAEKRRNWHLRITATDSSVSGFISTVTVAVQVTNDNDNSPKITNLPPTIEVNELEVVGAVINTCIVTDKDTVAELQGQTRVGWPNSDGVYETWLVDSVTCKLYLAKPLDFETTTSYVLTLLARDLDPAAPLATSANFTINVLDGNDPPICPMYQRYIMLETDVIGTDMIVVQCTDIDLPTPIINYKIDDNNNDLVKASFSIDETAGLLQLKAKLNYDEAATHQIKIIAYEKDDPSVSSTTTVEVFVISSSIVNHPPVCRSSTVSLNEVSPVGTTVGRLACTDSDPGIIGEVSYQLDDTNSDLVKSSFMVTSTGEVKLVSRLNYEQEDSHQVKVIAYDAGIPSLKFTALISVNVESGTNKNHAPVCPFKTVKLAIESTAGAHVGVIECTDPDQGAEGVVYFWIDRTMDREVRRKFQVNFNTGEITLKANIDDLTEEQYDVKVIAYDGGIPASIVPATLQVIIVKPKPNVAMIVRPHLAPFFISCVLYYLLH
ncbi:protocadherin Fat 3 [Patella vulgata]|uniref:protocadherin Fat 3 n=1 Tax=Patella vulgata TaxID=6465 RepID=UPI0024A9BB2B|nr:protocadherin Fat 3 [Patella vulgata]